MTVPGLTEVEAGSRPDLDDPARRAGEQLAAVLGAALGFKRARHAGVHPSEQRMPDCRWRAHVRFPTNIKLFRSFGGVAAVPLPTGGLRVAVHLEATARFTRALRAERIHERHRRCSSSSRS